jgi:hypothetical protein
MRRVTGQEKHIAFADDDVAKFTLVDDLEHHSALVLVKPFWGLVYMVVGASIGTTDDLEMFSD